MKRSTATRPLPAGHQAHVGDLPDRVRELMAADPTDFRTYRPDILGTMSIGHDGGAWTMAIYFTSEEAAREGEQTGHATYACVNRTPRFARSSR